jgi:small subunit ribosomal protein S16
LAVKIRLTRMGKKKQPTYRVVVVDSRKPRDGAYIEQIGRYDARQEPSLIEIDNDRALHWLRIGAQPTDRAKKLLEISGAWTRYRIAKGDIHTIEAQSEPKVAPKPEPEIHVVGSVPAPEAEAAAEPVAEDTAATPETVAEAVADDTGDDSAATEDATEEEQT